MGDTGGIPARYRGDHRGQAARRAQGARTLSLPLSLSLSLSRSSYGCTRPPRSPSSPRASSSSTGWPSRSARSSALTLTLTRTRTRTRTLTRTRTRARTRTRTLTRSSAPGCCRCWRPRRPAGEREYRVEGIRGAACSLLLSRCWASEASRGLPRPGVPCTRLGSRPRPLLFWISSVCYYLT